HRSQTGPRLQSTTAAIDGSARRRAPDELLFPARVQWRAPSSGSRGSHRGSATPRTLRRTATKAKCAIHFAGDENLDRRAAERCAAREIALDQTRLQSMATVALQFREPVDREDSAMLVLVP